MSKVENYPKLFFSHQIPPRYYELRGVNTKTQRYETILFMESDNLDILVALMLFKELVPEMEIFINPLDMERGFYDGKGLHPKEDQGDMSGTDFLM